MLDKYLSCRIKLKTIKTVNKLNPATAVNSFKRQIELKVLVMICG